MSKNNFNAMTQQELRAYVLSHRQDKAAFEAYLDKVHQRLGIQEYWIVDYLAIASRAYLGNPKEPTVFVQPLVDGKYQAQSFAGNSKIISPTFSKLHLTGGRF